MRSTLDVFQTVFDVLFQTDFTLDEYSLLQTVKQMPKNQCVFVLASLREKCPKTKLFLVRIFVYSVRIQQNTDQK